MANVLMTQGPLSLCTELEVGDSDPEQEAAQKLAGSQQNPKLHLPQFDPAHGKRPGGLAGRPVGRKAES